MNLTKFYINGEFVDPSSKETLEIINPATEEEIGKLRLVLLLMLIRPFILQEKLLV